MSVIIPAFGASNIAALAKIGYGMVAANISVGVNLATTFYGGLFKASSSSSLTAIKLFIFGTSGTVTNGMQVDLYAVDANYRPTGSSLATATVTPVGNSLQTITWSAAYTPTAGTMYFVQVKNVLGTPASNFFTLGAGLDLWNPLFKSTDSGTTWYQNPTNPTFIIVEVYGSTIYSAHMACGHSGQNGLTMYSTSASTIRRNAVKVNLGPGSGKLWGIKMNLGDAAGSPTHYICGELCSSSASIATTKTVVPATVANESWFEWWFDNSNVPTLDANTDYWVGLCPCDSSGTIGGTNGDSTHHVNMGVVNNGNAQPTNTLGVLFGSFTSTAVAPSWSEQTTYEFPIDLMIEAIGGSGGSASMLVHPGMSGRCNG